jgi:hypothetical protein
MIELIASLNCHMHICIIIIITLKQYKNVFSIVII